MKNKILCLCLMLISILMIGNVISATTWLSYREDIYCDTGTCDVDDTISFTNSSGDGTVDYNLTLPFTRNALNASGYLNVSIFDPNDGQPWLNITINGTTYPVESQAWNTTNTQYYNISSDIGSGDEDLILGNSTNTWINFSWNTSSGTDIFVNITIQGDDISLYSGWLNASATVREADLNDIYVRNRVSSASWAINDSYNLSSSLVFDLTDLNLTVTYPDHAVSEPTTYFRQDYLNASSYITNYTKYLKREPYITKVSEDIDGRIHEVTVTINSGEQLSNIVYWEMDYTDDIYEDYFDTINLATLEVEMNSHDIDDWDEGSIDMEELSIGEGVNKAKFTWTEAAAVVSGGGPSGISAIPEVLGTTYGMFPLWIWIIIIAVIIIVAVVIIYDRKNK